MPAIGHGPSECGSFSDGDVYHNSVVVRVTYLLHSSVAPGTQDTHAIFGCGPHVGSGLEASQYVSLYVHTGFVRVQRA